MPTAVDLNKEATLARARLLAKPGMEVLAETRPKTLEVTLYTSDMKECSFRATATAKGVVKSTRAAWLNDDEADGETTAVTFISFAKNGDLVGEYDIDGDTWRQIDGNDPEKFYFMVLVLGLTLPAAVALAKDRAYHDEGRNSEGIRSMPEGFAVSEVHPDAPAQLYKTTIVIWTEYNPEGADPEQLARDADVGDGFCSTQQTELVTDQRQFPDTDFFMAPF
jgi:hypothetical protein